MKRCIEDFGDSGLDELICPRECPDCESRVDSEPATVSPSDGGCWYCNQASGDDLRFSSEFDTNVHLECIQNVLEGDPGDPEARIMSVELFQKVDVFSALRRRLLGCIAVERMVHPVTGEILVCAGDKINEEAAGNIVAIVETGVTTGYPPNMLGSADELLEAAMKSLWPVSDS